MPLHPKERDYREVMEENRAQILLADKLGLTEAWIGEHQTSIQTDHRPIPLHGHDHSRNEEYQNWFRGVEPLLSPSG